MIFCDTSALAKFYVPERETAAVRRQLESEDEVCASALARVELMGVFHRRLREGKWSRDDFVVAVRQFSRDEIAGFWTWLSLTETIVEAAVKTYASLPEGVFLRAADCLHLVTAVHHEFSDVYTYDAHQAAAAGALGIRALTA